MLLNDDFLLTTEWAKKLFHNHAERMPIIDYHCHLSPKEIWENEKFGNLAEIWICKDGAGDHYKWRLMRAAGVPEELISGNGDDYEKFCAFVKTVEQAPGNPIFEWSHLELRRFFGIDDVICEKNAKSIWDRANERISSDDFRPRQIIKNAGVKALCTTDDPADDLVYHKKLAEVEDLGFKVLPTYRPDGLLGIDRPDFADYCDRISDAAGVDAHSYTGLVAAAAARVDYFHSVGGRLADHGTDVVRFVPATPEELEDIVTRRLAGEELLEVDVLKYQTALCLELMRLYAEHNWVFQFHMNALRNANTRGFEALGRDKGYDSAGEQPALSHEVAHYLDAAARAEALPRTILYSLNENDWLGLVTLMQSFQGGCKQKLQLGCAWWVNDQFDGMKKQITMMAEQSLIANFTGMLTDSRSFLSYPRHEYFRRVLCHTIGEWVEQGRVPEDEDYLGRVVEDICYNNAHDYFGFFE
ncbi:glucuronate isomerase [Enorma sp.]|uniref:glucuronate isomerase n=1 Tax=Enorma sp. TaxID=1920692 RepID=UPI0025C14448|nr:glucuronate isomerase [Enorma sp.]